LAHPRHGERGFGDIGGQHKVASSVGREDFLLVGVTESRVERQHLGLGQLRATQKISRFENFALTRQKNQNVAAGDLVTANRTVAVAAFRAVADFISLPTRTRGLRRLTW
jgi:hypothetical protein